MSSSLSFYCRSGALRTQLCSPDSRWPCKSDAYCRFESLPGRLSHPVATSRIDDYACSCFPHVWTWSLSSHGHFSWANAHRTHFPVMIPWEEWPAQGTWKGASSTVDRCGCGIEACPTHEACVVMCADNVVEVCQIILDGICTEWAT